MCRMPLFMGKPCEPVGNMVLKRRMEGGKAHVGARKDEKALEVSVLEPLCQAFFKKA